MSNTKDEVENRLQTVRKKILKEAGEMVVSVSEALAMKTQFNLQDPRKKPRGVVHSTYNPRTGRQRQGDP